MLRLLFVATDPNLRPELERAIASLPKDRITLLEVSTSAEALESVRNRQPELLLIPLPAHPAGMRHFVEEATMASPATAVVGLYEADRRDADASSSLIIEAFRAGIRDVLRRPISAEDLDGLLSARDTRMIEKLGRPPAPVITFFATKGGVGKSTLAVNVSWLLAKERPGKVLLIDASIQLGVCVQLLDLIPQTTLTDVVAEKERLDATLIRELATPHSSGLHILAAPQKPMEASEVDDELLSRVITLARRSYDLVVVDTFPMVDQLTVAILDLSDRAYLITEGTIPTIKGTEELLRLLDELGFAKDRRRVVLNRSAKFYGSLSPRDIAKRLGVENLHVVPFEKQVLAAANLGVPAVSTVSRWSTFRKSVYKIADEIEPMVAARARAGGGNGG